MGVSECYLALPHDSSFLLVQSLQVSSDGSEESHPCHPCARPGLSSYFRSHPRPSRCSHFRSEPANGTALTFSCSISASQINKENVDKKKKTCSSFMKIPRITIYKSSLRNIIQGWPFKLISRKRLWVTMSYRKAVIISITVGLLGWNEGMVAWSPSVVALPVSLQSQLWWAQFGTWHISANWPQVFLRCDFVTRSYGKKQLFIIESFLNFLSKIILGFLLDLTGFILSISCLYFLRAWNYCQIKKN